MATGRRQTKVGTSEFDSIPSCHSRASTLSQSAEVPCFVSPGLRPAEKLARSVACWSGGPASPAVPRRRPWPPHANARPLPRVPPRDRDLLVPRHACLPYLLPPPDYLCVPLTPDKGAPRVTIDDSCQGMHPYPALQVEVPEKHVRPFKDSYHAVLRGCHMLTSPYLSPNNGWTCACADI